MTLSARSVSRNLVRLAVTMEESLAIHVEHSSDETLRDGVKKKIHSFSPISFIMNGIK